MVFIGRLFKAIFFSVFLAGSIGNLSAMQPSDVVIILDSIGEEKSPGEMCSLLVQSIDELCRNQKQTYGIVVQGSLLRTCIRLGEQCKPFAQDIMTKLGDKGLAQKNVPAVVEQIYAERLYAERLAEHVKAEAKKPKQKPEKVTQENSNGLSQHDLDIVNKALELTSQPELAAIEQSKKYFYMCFVFLAAQQCCSLYQHTQADLFLIVPKSCVIKNADLKHIEKLSSLRDMVESKVSVPKALSSMLPQPVRIISLFGHGAPTKEKENVLCADLSRVAGLDFNNFKELMPVFQAAGAAWLNVYTCFGGGLTRRFFEKILHDIKASFIAVSYGMNELVVRGCLLEDWNLQLHNGCIQAQYPYSIANCFTCLGDTLTKLKDAKIPEKEYELCAHGLRHAVWLPTAHSNQQPFVRLPNVGKFVPVAVDPKVMLVDGTQAVQALDARLHDMIVIQQEEVKQALYLKVGTCLVSSLLPEVCKDTLFSVKQDSGVTHTLDHVEIHGFKPGMNLFDFEEVLWQIFVEKNVNFNKTFKLKTLVCHKENEKWVLSNVVISIRCRHIHTLDSKTEGEMTLEYSFSINNMNGKYSTKWPMKTVLDKLKTSRKAV